MSSIQGIHAAQHRCEGQALREVQHSSLHNGLLGRRSVCSGFPVRSLCSILVPQLSCCSPKVHRQEEVAHRQEELEPCSLLHSCEGFGLKEMWWDTLPAWGSAMEEKQPLLERLAGRLSMGDTPCVEGMPPVFSSCGGVQPALDGDQLRGSLSKLKHHYRDRSFDQIPEHRYWYAMSMRFLLLVQRSTTPLEVSWNFS